MGDLPANRDEHVPDLPVEDLKVLLLFALAGSAGFIGVRPSSPCATSSGVVVPAGWI